MARFCEELANHTQAMGDRLSADCSQVLRLVEYALVWPDPASPFVCCAHSLLIAYLILKTFQIIAMVKGAWPVYSGFTISSPD